MRRVHKEKRIFASSKEQFDYFGILLWKILAKWAIKNSIEISKTNLLLDQYFGQKFGDFSNRYILYKKINQLLTLIKFDINPLNYFKYSSHRKYLYKVFSLPNLIKKNEIG